MSTDVVVVVVAIVFQINWSLLFNFQLNPLYCVHNHSYFYIVRFNKVIDFVVAAAVIVVVILI